jgi:hypothetical protein
MIEPAISHPFDEVGECDSGFLAMERVDDLVQRVCILHVVISVLGSDDDLSG